MEPNRWACFHTAANRSARRSGQQTTITHRPGGLDVLVGEFWRTAPGATEPPRHTTVRTSDRPSAKFLPRPAPSTASSVKRTVSYSLR
jgi:hypothetical protein